MARKILIVDDEPLARRRILSFLEQRSGEFEVSEARNGMEALGEIARLQPDIVFLDVDMPEMTGIDVLMHLQSYSFKVIFQTAYDDFAAKAFELSAVDFLLKPFTAERFFTALDRSLALIDQSERLQQLERRLIDQKKFLRRFALRVGSRSRVVTESEVLYFSSEEHVTQIHLSDISFAYEHSLALLEQRLDPDSFLRVHRSAIVNLSAVSTVSTTRPMIIKLNNGEEIKVSREREKFVRRAIHGTDVLEDD